MDQQSGMQQPKDVIEEFSNSRKLEPFRQYFLNLDYKDEAYQWDLWIIQSALLVCYKHNLYNLYNIIYDNLYHWAPVELSQFKESFCFKKDKHIYVKPIQGVGNRLLVLNSIYSFARRFGFTSINICWSGSKGFSEEKFEDLFDISSLPKNIKIKFIEPKEFNTFSEKLVSVQDFISQDPASLEYTCLTDKLKFFDIISNTSFSYEGYASLDWLFSEDHTTDEEYVRNIKYRWGSWQDSSEFLTKYIKANSVLQKAIDATCDNLITKDDWRNNKSIGLHIRRGDATIGPWKKHYLVSTDEMFIETIQSYLQKDKNQTFFLSTDCKDTEDKFLKLFPKNIIVQNNKPFSPNALTEDKPKDYQAEAIIDLFCLSNTSRIYGTNWSTFSVIAANINEIPIKFLQTDHEETKEVKVKVPNISVVTALKNRSEALAVSLPSWLNKPEIKEIIIVDWSSKDYNLKLLEGLDPRIKVITVKNKKHFHIAKAYNLGFKHATENYIMKLDVDYVLNPYVPLSVLLNLDWESEFMTGLWSLRDKDNNIGFIEHLQGMICIKKELFEEAGGYNESFTGYGYEDTELYTILEKLGLHRKHINIGRNFVPVFHIPHDNYYRTQFYEEKNRATAHNKNKELGIRDV